MRAVEMTRCPTLPFAGGDLWPEWLTPPPRGHLPEAPGAFLLMEHWSEEMSLPGRSSQETSVLYLLFFFFSPLEGPAEDTSLPGP